MSKVYRCDEKKKETSNINVPWIAVLVAELEKKAAGVDYLQQVFQKGKFSSIDEKMADIKERIGFDLINKVSEELDKRDGVKTASEHHDCGCGGPKKACACDIKTAEYKHPEDDVSKMANILSYIQDMVKSEPHLDTLTVVSRCKDEENLKFDDLRINMSKLKEYIEENLQSVHSSDEPEVIVYMPQEPLSQGDIVDDVADYYRRTERS